MFRLTRDPRSNTLDKRCLSQVGFAFENDSWPRVPKTSPTSRVEDLLLIPTASLQVNFMTISEMSKLMMEQFGDIRKKLEE